MVAFPTSTATTSVLAVSNSVAAITSVANQIGGLLVATPQTTVGYQPQTPFGLNSQPQPQGSPLLFHYEGEQSAVLESDITDHYVENNTAVQDQITLKPIRITTHGFIGELNDVVPPLLAPLQTLASKLTAVSTYAPRLSATAINAFNEAFFAYQTAQSAINSAVGALNTLSGNPSGESVISSTQPISTSLQSQPNQNKQQQMFQQLYSYWANRTFFTIQTPWAVFDNMAIERFRAVQEAETNVITDFEITFKQIRFASTQVVNAAMAQANFQGRSAVSAFPGSSLGVVNPTPSISINSALGSNYSASFPGAVG